MIVPMESTSASANLAKPGDAGGAVDVTVSQRGTLVVFRLAGKAPEGTPAAQVEMVELTFTVDEAMTLVEQAVDAVDRITTEHNQVQEACCAMRQIMTMAYTFGNRGVDLRRE